ncbi:sulfotransferase, partial [Calditrichota bacterium]
RIFMGKRLLVEKEPLEPIAFPLKDYEQFLKNVRRLFPEIKFLLVIRDPIATIWSMKQRTWGSSLTNIETKKFTIEEYVENWCSCADIILQYCSDPNTYILRYRRLVNDPENESRRIIDFLNICKRNSFQPRQTKEIGFSNEEREKILLMVQPKLELLNAQGISDLS